MRIVAELIELITSRKAAQEISWRMRISIFAVAFCLLGCAPDPPSQEDQQRAARFGLEIDVYMNAKSHEIEAYTACQIEAKSHAKYDSKTADCGLFQAMCPEGWTTDGKTIYLTGHDIEFQNVFGAYQRVAYDCTYDLASSNVTSLLVREP